MHVLIHGCIPPNTVCPYTNSCEKKQQDNCSHRGEKEDQLFRCLEVEKLHELRFINKNKL